MVFTEVYISKLVLLFSCFIFHILFRKTSFTMAPVCSRNYKNSDSACTHQKQCDALGPKVQYSTNNEFYSLLADRVQQGPHHLSDMAWKVGRRTKGFSICCFMTSHGTENGFWKPLFVYFHQQTWDHVTMIHPVCSSHRGNSQTLGTSIRFSNCHHEIQHPGSSVMVFRVQWDLLKKVLAATSHWKGKRLRESQCHHRVAKRLPVSKLSSLVSYIQQFHIHLALSLKLPSIILSGKAMKSRGTIPWRHNVKVKKTGGKRKHISAHLSVLKGVRGTRK